MTLDPAIRVFLDQIAALGAPPPETLSVAEAREGYRLMIAADAPPEPVADVADHAIPGPAGPVSLRVYRPAGDGTPRAVLVWFHGGGYVIGDLDTADAAVRRLVNRAGVVGVSVDYRRAPEHSWPMPVDDGWAAVEWVADNAASIGGDPSRVAVGGDSAGGNLAACIAVRAAAEGGPALAHQCLVYPWVDLTMSYPSIVGNGDGYLLTRAEIEWFRAHYLQGADPADPSVSPLFADLSGVAPATVISAGFDPLRDENAAFADRLAAAGVPVAHRCYDSMIHAFFALGAITPVALEAADEVAAPLARLAAP